MLYVDMQGKFGECGSNIPMVFDIFEMVNGVSQSELEDLGLVYTPRQKSNPFWIHEYQETERLQFEDLILTQRYECRQFIWVLSLVFHKEQGHYKRYSSEDEMPPELQDKIYQEVHVKLQHLINTPS